MDEVEAGRRETPDHELLVGGFPCQDYSVAKTRNQAIGIVGKKGVLWWEIHRLLTMKRPPYLFLENVDRLLKSPTSQRGRDFGVMLATLADLGYEVEWRVVNAADYGYPQKRRRSSSSGAWPVEQPRDPDDVLHHGIAGASAADRPWTDLSRLTTASRSTGDPVEVSEGFGATKGGSPFRNAGYMSHRRVWTLDVAPDWDGPGQTLGRRPGASGGRPRSLLRPSWTSCRAGSTSRAPSASSATTRSRIRRTSTWRGRSPTPTGPTGRHARS